MSFRILSIDGGGIRGIIPGKVLIQLESEIRIQYGNDKNIADYFDLITGTSTGGILALGLCIADENNLPKYEAQDLLNIYVERGDDIFDISIWKSITSVAGLNDEKYDASELEDALNDYFADVM
ncbi:MAG: patatin, partial [Gammaproteobacteria bacterium]|nr:patatin [Gammaproteobacteria bacterium]